MFVTSFLSPLQPEMGVCAGLFMLGLAVVSAFPSEQIVAKLDDGPRYQHVQDAGGELHLVDLWLKTSDLREAARYNPDSENEYHLFTRQNPSVSQPMLMSNGVLIGGANFNPSRRTVLIMHGWFGQAASMLNSMLVPAFLYAADANVIVVDWSAGAQTINYIAAVINTATSGASVGNFINQLNAFTGAQPHQYIITGHSLGGHQCGIAGRHVVGDVDYIISLDPAGPGWQMNSNKLQPTDGRYTEVLHTNVGQLGYTEELGDADFYPNEGVRMPGCNNMGCDHDRCIHYLAESLYTGGFSGQRCESVAQALQGGCESEDTLNMGGIESKTGSSGIFWMETNAASPFSRR